MVILKKALNIICIVLCVILAISTAALSILYYKANSKPKDNTVSSSQLESSENESETTSSSAIDTSITKDLGTFDNVEDLQIAVERNPYQTTMLTVTVTGYAYRNSILYIGDMKEYTNSTGTYTEVDSANAVYVEVNNDTTNRALTGDKIKVTGDLYIFTEYYTMPEGEERIKAALYFARHYTYNLNGGFYIANAKYEIIG